MTHTDLPAHTTNTDRSDQPAAHTPISPTLIGETVMIRPAALGVADGCVYVGGISKQTMYRLHAAGRVRMIKIGRRSVIPIADLDALLFE